MTTLVRPERPAMFDPPTVPEPFNAPRMAGPTREAVRAKVWRVREPELEALCAWLVPRLQEDWPRLSETGLVYWMKAAMTDRHTLFCRTPGVAGLFFAHTDALDPDAVVTERFVRQREPLNEEAKLLYRYARDWARSIGAGVFHFNRDSDCSMAPQVVPGLTAPDSPVKKRSVYWTPFER